MSSRRNALLATLALALLASSCASPPPAENRQDVYFLERRPAPGTPEHESTGKATLHAYTRGYRYTVETERGAEGCDVEAVLGLLNVVLSRRKSDLRYARLAAPTDRHDIVLGPRVGLLRARSAGLLAFGPPWGPDRQGLHFDTERAPSLDQDLALD